MKHLFIINSVAGTSNRTKEVKELINNLLKPDEFEIFLTKNEGDAENYLANLLQKTNEKYRVYACGGDGTLNAVVNASVGYDVEITNYPIGSGNDFLRFFKNRENFYELEKLIDGKVIDVDLIKANDKYCINIFNIGFDGKVVSRQRKVKRFPFISGGAAYNISVGLCVLGRLNNIMKLSIDGKEVYNGKGVLCAIANGKCYGGGFYCSPEAKIDDGIIDVCLIKKVGLLKFASLVKVYKAGKHVNNKDLEKYVLYQKGKHIELEMKKELYFANDGELGKTNKVVLDILPRMVKFVVPVD